MGNITLGAMYFAKIPARKALADFGLAKLTTAEGLWYIFMCIRSDADTGADTGADTKRAYRGHTGHTWYSGATAAYRCLRAPAGYSRLVRR